MKYPVIDMEKTGKHLQELLKEKEISVSSMKDRMGLQTTNAIYKWLSGKSMPTIDNLLVLSCLLDIKMDELIIVK